ncbi:hypothetical protein HYW76_05755 [Candidatus Pacearchaeota archaeon]|nr:hypothetical protein [Candidatus Pacearchaeota archaeon]
MVNKPPEIIHGRYSSELETYNATLKKLIRKKFIVNNDKKIAMESRAALEICWANITPVIILSKKGIIPKISYELYGDYKNKKATEECEYYYETIFSSGKLDKVINLIKVDSSTKKAVIYLIDKPKPKNNLIPPCMTCLFFRIINGKLNMHCHMRANNAYLIFLINLHINHMIHSEAARRLGMKVGNYFHFIDSFHIYKSELKKAESYLKTI